jgi:hypothetical protein
MSRAPKVTTEQLRECAEAGFTRHEAAELLGASYITVAQKAKRYGIEFARRYRRVNPLRPWKDDRLTAIVPLYRDGYTLQQIADQYGLTRERIRQILRKAGVDPTEGGNAIRARRNRAATAAKREAKYLAKYGCTVAQYQEIRRIGEDMMANGSSRDRTPLTAFKHQQSNAGRRGIAWQLNLWQWWTIWQASGHWNERGRGQGYCMCRHGDEGPYSAGNVFIDFARHNSSEQKRKKSGLPIGVKANKRYAGYTAYRSVEGKKKSLGSFPTPELAHAAYLLSLQQEKAAA